MDLLQVRGNQIVDSSGHPVRLRGTCVGGWMNMEHFINGYPGTEHGLRMAMTESLGGSKAQFFFDRLLDYMLSEEDIRFIKSCGASVIRLPLNYRHFESDARPFSYLEPGFQRLDRAIQWCRRHGLYVILDLHSVQGWQNPDWHCDNAGRQTLFWNQAQFQDRFVALWEEFARRYRDEPAIAGYNVMNEPVTNAPLGRYSDTYSPNWEVLNRVYRRVVAAIKKIDPRHIIFLEGDLFSTQFDGLEPPFADNLAYSSHNYNPGGFGPGSYPGTINGERWDLAKQEDALLSHQGMLFAKRHQVPLWAGEFGSVYNGAPEELPGRYQALNDQIGVFERHGVHWTTWTYKDVGVMGWMHVDPQSEYMRRAAPALQAKLKIGCDFWMHWLPQTRSKQLLGDLAEEFSAAIGDPPIDQSATRHYLIQTALDCYAGHLLQPVFANCFKGLTESELDRTLQSFALGRCLPNQSLIDVVRRYSAVDAPAPRAVDR